MWGKGQSPVHLRIGNVSSPRESCLQKKHSLIVQGGKISVPKLPFEDWLVCGVWSRAEQCCSGWSCIQGLHVHSLLCQSLGGVTSLMLVQQMQRGLPPPPAIPILLWQPRLKLNSREKKNNGNKSYSILKLFSGSCLRENKELLPKPTLVLLQGPNMTEITPVRNFRRAMLCFQSFRRKSCRSSVCLGILLLQCLCLAVEIQSKSWFPRSCHETVNWNFKHSCIPAFCNGISCITLFLRS